MSDQDAEAQEFAKAMARIPRPVICFANGAVCPWCGSLHKTVTFGANECVGCHRSFCFGYPDWLEGKEPVSYVPFPWKEWDAFKRADLMENWVPNKALKEIYFRQTEEQIGIFANAGQPN